MFVENEDVTPEVPEGDEGVSFEDAAAEAIASEGEEGEKSEEEISEDDEAVVEEETAEKPEEEPPLKDQDFDSIDPTKLPEEVQKFYKGMQASFTKKMQTLQQSIDSLSPHKDRLSLIDKAIQGDKEAQASLARIAGKQEAEVDPKVADEEFYKDLPQSFENTKQLAQFFDKRFGSFLKTYIHEALPQMITKHIAPAMEPLNEMRQNSLNKALEADIARLKTTYPDFDNHLEKMIELKKTSSGLTLEQAYKLASYRSPVSPKKIVSKPSGNKTVPIVKEIKNFDDAASEALKIMKKTR